MLLGLVEMDESYVGDRKEGKRGRGAEGKTPVAVMAERSPGGGLSLAHMQVVERVNGLCLGEAAAAAVAPGSTILTDGWSAYRHLSGLGYHHAPVVQGDPENAAELLPWVHVVISNFKRWILDLFHGVSPKHLQSCLDEFCHRLNRHRLRTDLFRSILRSCVRYTEPLTYAQLTAS